MTQYGSHTGMSVLSNGKNVAVVQKTNTGIIVYYCEQCYPTSISMNMQQRTIDVHTLNSPHLSYVPRGIEQTCFTIDFTSFGKCIVGDEELIEKFRTVDSLSIEGLFEIIQSRIKERN